MAAGSRMDTILSKAISNGSGASGIIDLRGKSYCATLAGERSESTSSADIKAREEEGGGGAPDARAEIPLQPVVKTVVRQLCPCSP